MRRPRLTLADKIALIALGGIVVSLSLWLAAAVVEHLLSDTGDLGLALFAPSLESSLTRAMLVVGVLCATLLIQTYLVRVSRADHALAIEQNRTRQMYENSPDRVVCMDLNGEVLYANPAALDTAASESHTTCTPDCHRHIFGGSDRCEPCLRSAVITTRAPQSMLTSQLMPDGSQLYLDRLAYPVIGVDGTVCSVVEIARDVTELHNAQAELSRSHQDLEVRIAERTAQLQAANEALTSEIAERERVAWALKISEERHRRLIEDSPDMVLVHQQERVTFVNPAGLELLGARDLDDALGRDVMSLWLPSPSGLVNDDLERMILRAEITHPVPLKLLKLDGGTVDVEVTVSTVTLDEHEYVQCIARDITARVEAEQTIRRMAYYDELTGLPNRTLFKDRVGRALSHARREGGVAVVAFLDLDDFKAINDTLGHGIGDEVLRSVGERIAALLRDTDTVARHSGDEFTIVAQLASADDLGLFANRILDGLRPAFNVEGHELHVTGSLGVTLFPQDGESVEELLKNADAAMYHAKELGQSQHAAYRDELRIAARNRLKLETELRKAVSADQFVLHYQPQIDLRTGDVTGVEALIRWIHPERGLLWPGEFLPVAEQAGLMSHMGRWVLSESLMHTREWLAEGIAPPRLAVNLGAQEFLRTDVVTLVTSLLEHAQVPAHMLEIEITEDVALRNVDKVMRTLSALREAGVRLAIDDFGTGYSSMSYLHSYPIDTIKIDRTFIARIREDGDDSTVTAWLIELCDKLDLNLVAEGVETELQRDFLMGSGCIRAQGNLLCPPLPADEMTEYLRHRARVAWEA